MAWSGFGQTHLVRKQARVQKLIGPVCGKVQPARYQFATFRLSSVLPQTSRIISCKTTPDPILIWRTVSGFGQTDPVRVQAGVRESSGPLLANASGPIRTGYESDPVCLTITITTIYFINPTWKLKLSFDRTTKNIISIILSHEPHAHTHSHTPSIAFRHLPPHSEHRFPAPSSKLRALLSGTFLQTPSIAFRHLPPNSEHCFPAPSSTLRASLSGTFLQRKDVVNQCLEFDTLLDIRPLSLNLHTLFTVYWVGTLFSCDRCTRLSQVPVWA